jgi:HD-GYP domain-containing protein (c-di-GMP phosphodiesterase class II)
MEFSIGICNEIGLSKEYTEMIRVAALLHDYGKIGVPDAILKKSGKLSSDEYQEIQTHAAKTRTILERISFEGIYEQIPEIAGCHHEKLDGSGYPKGLRGDEIPLGARIIAVADFFEAITAKRHYREPMQIDDAMELLKKEGLSRLDPDIIEAFISYYQKNYINR